MFLCLIVCLCCWLLFTGLLGVCLALCLCIILIQCVMCCVVGLLLFRLLYCLLCCLVVGMGFGRKGFAVETVMVLSMLWVRWLCIMLLIDLRLSGLIVWVGEIGLAVRIVVVKFRRCCLFLIACLRVVNSSVFRLRLLLRFSVICLVIFVRLWWFIWYFKLFGGCFGCLFAWLMFELLVCFDVCGSRFVCCRSFGGCCFCLFGSLRFYMWTCCAWLFAVLF